MNAAPVVLITNVTRYVGPASVKPDDMPCRVMRYPAVPVRIAVSNLSPNSASSSAARSLTAQ